MLVQDRIMTSYQPDFYIYMLHFVERAVT